MMIDIAEEKIANEIAIERGAKAKFIATGGILGAIVASSCCVLPLVLFSLGVTGAWIGKLTALALYQPFFIAITLGFLGYGAWLVYRKPQSDCDDGTACARPLPNVFVKITLWVAAALITLAILWPFIVPLILE